MSDGTIYDSSGTYQLTELSDAPDEADRLYVGDMSESTDADKNKFLKFRHVLAFVAEQTMVSLEYAAEVISRSSGEVVMRLGSQSRS